MTLLEQPWLAILIEPPISLVLWFLSLNPSTHDTVCVSGAFFVTFFLMFFSQHEVFLMFLKWVFETNVDLWLYFEEILKPFGNYGSKFEEIVFSGKLEIFIYLFNKSNIILLKTKSVFISYKNETND